MANYDEMAFFYYAVEKYGRQIPVGSGYFFYKLADAVAYSTWYFTSGQGGMGTTTGGFVNVAYADDFKFHSTSGLSIAILQKPIMGKRYPNDGTAGIGNIYCVTSGYLFSGDSILPSWAPAWTSGIASNVLFTGLDAGNYTGAVTLSGFLMSGWVNWQYEQVPTTRPSGSYPPPEPVIPPPPQVIDPICPLYDRRDSRCPLVNPTYRQTDETW